MSDREIPDLVTRARARTDAWPIVDGAHKSFLGQLGAIDNALASQGITQAEATRRREALIRHHAAWVRRVADAPERQLHGLLYPPTPAIEISRAQRAVHALDQARREGIRLSSPRPGMVEATPRSKIGQPLRELLRDYADEISAGLRSAIETFDSIVPEPTPAPSHRNVPTQEAR